MHELKTVLKKSWMVGLVLLLGAAPCLAAPEYDGLYVLDGFGNVHTVDSAPAITAGIDFGYEVAKDIALTGDENGVVDGLYLLTGFGDVFSFGNAPSYPGVERPYFGWDIARDVETAHDYTDGVNGQSGFFILDGFGGVFPIGDPSKTYFKLYRTAQSIEVGEDRYLYWGWDVAVALEAAVLYDNSLEAIRTNGYYILDKLGGVHWNIEDEIGDIAIAPWAGVPQPYFGWDIARDFELTKTGMGYYLLDGYGAIHPVGDAALAFATTTAVAATPFFGWDIAKDIEIVSTETGAVSGLVLLDGYGGLHELGDVGIQNPLPLFTDEDSNPWDIAEDMEVSPFFEFVTDAVVSGP